MPLFQNESWCETIHMKVCSAKRFIFDSCKSNSFHKKGFARELVLKPRHKGTGKWPIAILYNSKAKENIFHEMNNFVVSTESTIYLLVHAVCL